MIVDEKSQYTWVYFMKTKSKTSKLLQCFVTFIQTQFQKHIKAIRTDNSPQILMKSWYLDIGIQHETSCVYAPQQNGILERKHQHILSMPLSSEDPFDVPNVNYSLPTSDNSNFCISDDNVDVSNAIPDQNAIPQSSIVPQATRGSTRVSRRPIYLKNYLVNILNIFIAHKLSNLLLQSLLQLGIQSNPFYLILLFLPHSMHFPSISATLVLPLTKKISEVIVGQGLFRVSCHLLRAIIPRFSLPFLLGSTLLDADGFFRLNK
jgi:hypothetical protein